MRFLPTFVLIFFFIGCGMNNYTSVQPQKITISTPGIRIIDQNGIFSIESGKVISPPFYNSNVVFYGNISNDFMSAIGYGAKRVFFIQDGKKDTLYGILYLGEHSSVITNYNQYTLSFAENALATVRDGNTNYFAEYLDVRKFKMKRGDKYLNEVFTWILWLSNDKTFGTINFDGRPWKLGYKGENKNQNITEYVLENETVNNWSELHTIQHLENPSSPFMIQDIVDSVKFKLKLNCPELEWKIISDKQDNIIYEWNHKECNGLPAQHELSRVFLNGNKVSIIRYTFNGIEMPKATYNLWLNILRNYYSNANNK